MSLQDLASEVSNILKSIDKIFEKIEKAETEEEEIMLKEMIAKSHSRIRALIEGEE